VPQLAAKAIHHIVRVRRDQRLQARIPASQAVMLATGAASQGLTL